MDAKRRRLARLLLILYFAGIVADFAWHVHLYLTTGDRRVDAHEWVTGLEASLFWPLDVVAQLLLALR